MQRVARRITTYRSLAVGCLLVVLVNTWIAGRSLAKLFDAERWQAHTLEVITDTQGTLFNISSANNSVRAYMLTGDPEYKNRYKTSQDATFANIDKLQQATLDNPGQQERIRILRQRARIRFASMDAALALGRKTDGSVFDQTVLSPALNESPDGGITMRYAIEQIEGEERRLLADRYRDTARSRKMVIAAFSGAALLDIVLLMIAFELLVRAERARVSLADRALEINQLNNELKLANASLEERVADRTRELQVSNQELEAFSYSVSHDLRAPLRTIDGFSLALQEDFADVLNEEGRDYIARVRGGVQRMGQLIDALLQLSRVTRSDITRERLDLSQLATNVFNELQIGDPDRNVEWVAQPGVMVEGDPRLLRIALENLIGNAWKFTSKVENPRIEFGTGTRLGKTIYFIRDNGAGFDMQYVDRLFTAFQRLHGDRDFKGSGIGLATVSRIIRRHHGINGAESQVGHGAMFYFTLGA